jgi:hypothetical protein
VLNGAVSSAEFPFILFFSFAPRAARSARRKVPVFHSEAGITGKCFEVRLIRVLLCFSRRQKSALAQPSISSLVASVFRFCLRSREPKHPSACRSFVREGNAADFWFFAVGSPAPHHPSVLRWARAPGLGLASILPSTIDSSAHGFASAPGGSCRSRFLFAAWLRFSARSAARAPKLCSFFFPLPRAGLRFQALLPHSCTAPESGGVRCLVEFTRQPVINVFVIFALSSFHFCLDCCREPVIFWICWIKGSSFLDFYRTFLWVLCKPGFWWNVCEV